MQRKYPKEFSVLKILAFESGTNDSFNSVKDTCHWESMCYETPLRFNIPLREIFFKSSSLRVMKKDAETSFMKISQEFGIL